MRHPLTLNVRSIGWRPALMLSIAVVLGAVPGYPADAEDVISRCGPSFVHVERDHESLILLCEKSDSVMRVDSNAGTVVQAREVGEQPFALDRHPDGRYFVSCRRGQEIVELDGQSLEILRRFALRGDPTGVAVSEDGRRLYAGVHSLDQVAVFDLDEGKEIKRLAAGNGPEMVRLAPRQGRIYVTNLLSNPVPPDRPCENEVTVIEDSTGRIVDRILLENANVGRGIAFSEDGSRGVMAVSRPKNLVPMAQVARGWVVSNGFAVLTPRDDGPPVQLLVDLPNDAYADPHGVAMAPSGEKFYLSCAGRDTVVAVDLRRVDEVIAEVRRGAIPYSADHLGLSRRYVTARIEVGANPQAIALSADGRALYVANRLDDSVSVIDTSTDRVVRTFSLGDPGPEDKYHRGERYFHSAARTFQRQFSCASCHPDLGFDGLRYDMEPDGIGENIIDNRNMRDVAGTAPFKWVGTNPDITTQCGTRTAKWITRTGWLSSMQVVELAEFIRSIPPVVNPYRSPDGKLTAAQQRGKALFERTTTNTGEPIAERDRCNFCHAGPKGFDGRQFDVGTKASSDTGSEFDTAHLSNVFESAPYLHDGRAATLEEIWTKFNLEDKHGISSDWTKRQLNDLMEYLKSL